MQAGSGVTSSSPFSIVIQTEKSVENYVDDNSWIVSYDLSEEKLLHGPHYARLAHFEATGTVNYLLYTDFTERYTPCPIFIFYLCKGECVQAGG